jgi:dCTP deaminase
MMLGTEDLWERIEAGGSDPVNGVHIVPTPNKDSIQKGRANSVDLRLGRWFLAMQQTRTTGIDLRDAYDSEDFEARIGKMTFVSFGQPFVIHPGRFVVAATLEWVKVPETLGGYITGRSSLGRRGLIIETAAGLHPCFSGCIALEITNCGEVPIALVPGMRICQVFFFRLSRRSPDDQTSFGGRRRPTFGDYKPDELVRRSRFAPRSPTQATLFDARGRL